MVHPAVGQHSVGWFVAEAIGKLLGIAADRGFRQDFQQSHLYIMGAHGKHRPKRFGKSLPCLKGQAEDEVDMEMDITHARQSGKGRRRLNRINTPIDC